jgi:hypothetical protein
MSGTSETLVFFRNDDVNRMEPGLAEVTQLFMEQGVPIAHAVEPANLSAEVRDWLLARRHRGVEIVQHGFAHTKHDLGEFGGTRSASAQRDDLTAGLRIMRESFGDAFFPAMSFPFGHYNENTVPILDELGYLVLSSHVRHQFNRRVFYLIGRNLHRGRWLGRHVSHHLARYPRTGVFEISVAISPISRYLHDSGATACEFYGIEELRHMFRTCRRQSSVVGIVLHHRFHAGPGGLDRLTELLTMLRGEPGVGFASIAAIHQRFAKAGVAM